MDATFDFDALFDVSDYLYFYEDTLREEDTPAQVDFLARELGLDVPVTVLDLGCGHGRHANELARRGHHVTGVDLVRGFLDVAVKEANDEGLTVDYRLGDLRALDYHGEFDAAVCLFDAFGFFKDEDNAKILANVARALAPGGRFALDLRNRDWIVRNIPPLTMLEKGDDLMIDRHAFDVETGRLVDRRTIVRGGKVKRVAFSVRLYALSEIRALLASLGLDVRAAYGDYRGGPPALSQNRLVVVADKR